jgi:hypothetical protein
LLILNSEKSIPDRLSVCRPNDWSGEADGDNVIFWSKDLSRSIDYLETRQDINPNELAYEGYSWGAALGDFSRLWKLASKH